MAKSITLSVRPSGVGVITIDTPESKLNILSSTLMSELSDALDSVTANKEITGLVIISGKQDNFIAGANLDEVKLAQQSPAAAFAGAESGKAVFAKLLALPYRTVAAINGQCLGGGSELTLACKYRLVSNDRKTKISFPEVKFGFLPGWAGTVTLPHIVGVGKAIEIATTGAEQNAQTAWEIGLVDEIVDADKLLVRAEEVALLGNVNRYPQSKRRAAKRAAYRAAGFKPAKLFPLVAGSLLETRFRGFVSGQVLAQVKALSKGFIAPVEIAKLVIRSASEGITPKMLKAESTAFAALCSSDISKNLLGIYFATQESKKSPNSIRPTIDVKKVGVAGAGVMGAGIAQAALYAGYDVVLYDKFPQGLEKGVATIKGLFDGLVSKGKLTQQKVDGLLAHLKTSTDTTDFAGCDLVVEAIVENMKLKKALVADLDKVVGKPYIFATNTSSLSVSEMVADAAHPENSGGLHFFNPVHKMPLVEIVAGKQSSPEAVAALKAFAMRLGKTTVTTADAPGFVVNRILVPYGYEAIRLLEEGVPAKDIEDAMRAYGMPMGPLALLDEVGLDVAGKVIHVLNEALGARLAPPKLMSFIESQKLLGKKSGKGIYVWENGKRGDFNPEVLEFLNVQPRPMPRTAIQERLTLVMINEASRCLEEKVVEDASQLDLAMIFGCGFPPYRGGVMRYADSIGSRTVAQNLTWLAKVAGDNYKPSALILEKARTGERFYR